MKISKVAVAAGATFTSVRATIPAHEVRAIEDASPLAIVWEVQFPDDNYVSTYTYAAGKIIERVGANVNSIVGRPANYNSPGHPALGDIYFKIRDKAGTGGNLRMIESETAIPDDIT